jgi:predicted amidohydrolase YtcJ
VGDRPALLARADMHSCIVSTALLDHLDLADLEGVDRDDRGPTGYLRELAASEAWKWFDASLTPEQQREAVLTAVRLAYSRGIAEVHEMFVVEWRGWDSAERFLATIEDVALTIVPYLATDEVKRVHDMGMPRIGGDWFLDGSFGSHTAWMRDGYISPPPEGSPPDGISYRADDDLYDLFRHAQELNMQVGVHAIGDAAIDQALATWRRVADDVGIDAVRKIGHRIEHFECAADEHIEWSAELGIRPSIQPAFDRFWGGRDGLYARRIGWERARSMNRFRTMSAGGLVIGGGSDSTVTPLDPFLQLASLRAHHVPQESLAPFDALAAMTSGVAALEPRVGPRGFIAEGTWADLALLDRDPLTTSPDDLLATQTLGTWVRGRRVWPQSEAETA